VVFELAPIVQATIMFLGIITLLIAGMSALVQRDIKKILAYSTISQLGYMFLALGVSAYTASLFHFVTHAFFKSLLFLGAGSVILHLHHEHDIRKMGGLKDQLPVTYLSFLAGAASLAALPLLTAGFYSKDAILWQVWNTPHYGRLYSVLGLLGSFITALYAFRLVFTVFWGEKRHSLPRKKSFTLEIPLIILAVLSLTAGFVNLPENFGSHLQWLEQSFHNSLLVNNHQGNHSGEWLFQVISSIVVVLGIFLAYVTYVKRPGFKKNWEKRFWYQYLQRGWGFDDLYKHAIIRPFEWVARINKNDLFDGISKLSVAGSKKLHGYLNYIQNGKVRWYAMSIGVGIILSVVLILLSA
jgi:NADH-quinone oxidoreductase subunit L